MDPKNRYTKQCILQLGTRACTHQLFSIHYRCVTPVVPSRGNVPPPIHNCQLQFCIFCQLRWANKEQQNLEHVANIWWLIHRAGAGVQIEWTGSSGSRLLLPCCCQTLVSFYFHTLIHPSFRTKIFWWTGCVREIQAQVRIRHTTCIAIAESALQIWCKSVAKPDGTEHSGLIHLNVDVLPLKRQVY